MRYKSLADVPEYVEQFMERARQDPRVTADALVREIGPDERGLKPDPATVRSWIRRTGLCRATFSEAYKQRVIGNAQDGGEDLTLERLVKLSGVDERGIVPTKATVSIWLRNAGVSLATTRNTGVQDGGASPAPISSPGGDSWQAAWDAAEGKDGAAWADAVLCAWFPDGPPPRTRFELLRDDDEEPGYESGRLAA